jgi:hypothetical protein
MFDARLGAVIRPGSLFIGTATDNFVFGRIFSTSFGRFDQFSAIFLLSFVLEEVSLPVFG